MGLCQELWIQKGQSPANGQNSNVKDGDQSGSSKSGNDGKVNPEAAQRHADPPAPKQLDLDPEPHESKPVFDLESRWANIQASLLHERECWPVEQHRTLCERLGPLLLASGL